MAGEDPEFLRFVRSRPCLLAAHGGCIGATEAHHAGSSGMGMRAHDSTAIPLCLRHHIHDWHGATGYFKGWDKQQRRAWADEQIQRTQMAYADSLLSDPEIPF